MATPEQLRRNYNGIKGHLTRLINKSDTLSKATPIDYYQLETSLRVADLKFDQVSSTIKSYLNLLNAAETDPDEIDQTLAEISQYEDETQDKLNVLSNIVNQHKSNANNTMSQSSNQLPEVRLPTLDLPTFAGLDEENWDTFWTSFEVHIHKKSSLEQVSKFAYLISLLKGEAKKVSSEVEDYDPTPIDYYQLETSLRVADLKFDQVSSTIKSYLNLLNAAETDPDEIDQTLAEISQYEDETQDKLNVLSNIVNQHKSNANNTMSQSSNQLPEVRLPTLDISTFAGLDEENWDTFWTSFEVHIHKKSSLDQVSKFAYLISLLKGEAKKVSSEVENYDPTPIDYYQLETSLRVADLKFDQVSSTIKSYLNLLNAAETDPDEIDQTLAEISQYEDETQDKHNGNSNKRGKTTPIDYYQLETSLRVADLKFDQVSSTIKSYLNLLNAAETDPDEIDQTLAEISQYEDETQDKLNVLSNIVNQHKSNANNTMSQSSNQLPEVRLPTLDISTFAGLDEENWDTFWTSFEVHIHKKSSLDQVSKFAYLISLLKGEAKKVSSEVENYDRARHLPRWHSVSASWTGVARRRSRSASS
ncbi:uncharacterized protein [Procambarus clarkii]|uniref:uncharacterized protein n=1 Tax=Procambarus clarkii TaxID=6728 RepID=UPI0037430C80